MTNLGNVEKDWYSILEASPSDGLQDLKQKYQRLALLYHPDKQGPDVSSTQAEQHLHRFIQVDQAWKILSNQDTKRAYDLQLRASELQQSWPVEARVSLDDMSWDEDNEVYTYGCRCGGEFSLGRGEAEEEEEEEEEDAIVCCDTCSLSIEVKRTM